MVAGKLLHGLQVAVLTTAVLILTIAVAGLASGFSPIGLVAYLPRFAVVALGASLAYVAQNVRARPRRAFAAAVGVCAALAAPKHKTASKNALNSKLIRASF